MYMISRNWVRWNMPCASWVDDLVGSSLSPNRRFHTFNGLNGRTVTIDYWPINGLQLRLDYYGVFKRSLPLSDSNRLRLQPIQPHAPLVSQVWCSGLWDTPCVKPDPIQIPIPALHLLDWFCEVKPSSKVRKPQVGSSAWLCVFSLDSFWCVYVRVYIYIC